MRPRHLTSLFNSCLKRKTTVFSMLTILLSCNIVTAVAASDDVKILTTTSNSSQLLSPSTATAESGSGQTTDFLQINPSETYQTMDGFGFAITYSSCYNLMKMSAADRTAFLKKTYSTTDGYGSSYVRIAIGCCDFSSTEYTLCDTEGLEHFALQSDETNYIIPILKEILAINPNLKIMASPWTCPRWMKVDNLTNKNAKNSWTDGHLNPVYYDTYAQYFVKFIKAMNANGINIYSVSPQNEPLNKGNCASLYMPYDEEAAFVKVLASEFKSNAITTKIYIYDHNYNYDDISSQNDYPIKVYNAMGSSFDGSELVVGAAYHNYGGSNSELTDIYNQAPDKELIFSETSIGEWNNGRNLSTRLLADMNDVVLGTVNKQCKAILVWNLMLDLNKSPNLDGGCQTCYGAVDINQNNYKTLSYNSHYYIISHMSSVVDPGAVRIGIYSTTTVGDGSFVYSAFKNPDGSYALVMLNYHSDWSPTITVSDGNQHFNVTVPANSVVSCRWNSAKSEITLTNSSPSITGTLVKGCNYVISGSSDFSSDSWYYDYDFFTKNSGGTFTFNSATGLYTVKADFDKKCFRIWAMNDDSNTATLSSDGTGAVWIIGNDGIGKPSYSSASGQSWNTDTDHALCMTRVGDKTYQTSLTIGKQLNGSNVNFKLSGQCGLDNVFKGSSSVYHISTASSLLAIGNGNGHEDGSVYLQNGKSLIDGDTYLLNVNLTNGISNATMSFINKNNVISLTATSSTVVRTMVKGECYYISGSSYFTGDSWYYDPDFFIKNSDGTFTFNSVTGLYSVQADFNNSGFKVWAMKDNSNLATLSSDGNGAIWVIGSDGICKPTYSQISGQGWVTDTSHALCMAQVRDKVYQVTLTVGRQLNGSDVNFKFFGQCGLGTEFKGSSSDYHISTSSSLFFIGDGNGHDDGNVYLQTDKTLTDGDTYVVTVDLSAGVGNAVLTLEKKNDDGSTTMLPGDVVFYIDGINETYNGTNKIYNLSGQKIKLSDLTISQTGVYIVNGKRIIKR